MNLEHLKEQGKTEYFDEAGTCTEEGKLNPLNDRFFLADMRFSMNSLSDSSIVTPRSSWYNKNMKISYSHTNIISEDYQRLAAFYCAVFGYSQTGPTRDLSGPWVDQLTNRKNTHIQGVHLELDKGGPTLEIFQYDYVETSTKAINCSGFSHIAFAVEDVRTMNDRIRTHGGSLLGTIVEGHVQGVGQINVAYAKDPEGNILEVQAWG